jgi:integrase
LSPRRHGLRASELVDLQWNQIDFDAGTLAVRTIRVARQELGISRQSTGSSKGLL